MAKAEFSSFTAMINCAIRLASAFSCLRMRRKCFHGFYDYSFVVRKDNGGIIISETEDIANVCDELSLYINPRYAAPSVNLGGKPDYDTDRYSLALILFMIFIRTHPLEEKRTLSVREMNENAIKLFYGSDPVFIADPDDDSNRPDEQIEGVRNFFRRWPLLPDYVQSLFIRAFSKEAMKNNDYPSEGEWRRTLLRFRAQLIGCPSCGREIFFEPSSHTCRFCKESYKVFGSLCANGCEVPIVKGAVLYREQLEGLLSPESFF